MNTQESNGLTYLLELMEAEKMDEAAAAWTRLARADARQACLAIRMLLGLHQVQAAQAWLETMETDHSGWMEAARCMLALAKGDLAAARQYGNLAIAGGADEAMIYDSVGQTAEQMDRHREALMFYLRAQQSAPADERLLRILSLMLRTGETQAALETLERIAAEKPQIDVRPIRVLLACVKGDKAEIEKHAGLLGDEDDTLLAAYARLQAGLALGLDVSAQLERLKAADATVTDLWIADACIARGQMAQAEEMLDRVAARGDADDAGHAFDMGRRYQMVGSPAKAKAQYEKADNGALPLGRALVARVERAHCLLATGEKDKGMQMLGEINLAAMQALMENPADTQLYLVRLRCYVEMGKKHEARELADFMYTICRDDATRDMIRSVVK